MGSLTGLLHESPAPLRYVLGDSHGCWIEFVLEMESSAYAVVCATHECVTQRISARTLEAAASGVRRLWWTDPAAARLRDLLGPTLDHMWPAAPTVDELRSWGWWDPNADAEGVPYAA